MTQLDFDEFRFSLHILCERLSLDVGCCINECLGLPFA